MLKKIENNRILEIVIFVGVALSLYAQTIGFDFVWDDKFLIVDNPFFQQNFRWYDAFKGDFWFFSMQGERYLSLYRPFVTLCFWLQIKFFGMNPAGFHGVNILLYLVSIYLFWKIAINFNIPRFNRIIAALFFVVHPANVACVSFISCQGDLLCQAFGLLSIFLWMKGDRYHWSALFFAFCSLLSKESGITFPLIMIAYDILIRKNSFRSFLTWLPLVIYPIYFLIRYSALDLNMSLQWKTIFFHNQSLIRLVLFIGRVLMPIPASQDPGVPVMVLWQTLFLLILVLYVAYLLVKRLMQYKSLNFFAIWLVFAFLPILDLTVMNVRFSDQLLYLPMVPVALLLGSYEFSRSVARYCIYLILLVFGCVSYSQIPIWENNYQFRKNEILHHPNSPSALASYASAYNIYFKTKEACSILHTVPAMLEKAYNKETDLQVNYNLGNCYLDTNPTESEKYYRKALDISPIYWIAKNNLVTSLIKQQKYQEALKLSQELVVQKPDLFIVWKNLGVAYAKLERYSEAIDTFEKAKKIKPMDDQIDGMIDECRIKDKLVQNDAQKNRK